MTRRAFALVPAAGKSSRMGRPKLLLPLGGRTVLARVVQAFHAGGVERVLVVTPPHLPDLAGAAADAGADVLTLDRETPDMRSTVEAGLEWLEERYHPAPEERWFLAPADHPALSEAVVKGLLRAADERPDCSVLLPSWQGRRGHPALIAWSQVAPMRAWPRGEGINAYLRRQEGETLLVPADCEDVLLDLDTPDDYERLKARPWQG
jgi:molybdenum cofactor cytidylyltransferase